MLPELSLEDRIAVVTGGGRGIGRAIALVLAEAGADVVIAARTTAEIESVANEVRHLNRRSLAIPTDVSYSADVDSLMREVMDTFGKIDILVNNAGQALKTPVVPLPDVTLKAPEVSREADIRMTDDEWQNLLDVNLSSVFYCCRSVAPYMITRRYGKIINVSSDASVNAEPLYAAYNTSKAGMNMLTRVMALEWADYNICVNGIGPGDYRTSMNEKTWSDPVARKRREEIIPMHRAGNLRELGLLAVYLASSASDYMTGQIVYLDGGLAAR